MCVPPINQHSGTLIDDLYSSAVRVADLPHSEAKVELYERIDEVVRMSRLYREAFMVRILDDAMTHLTDARPNSQYPDFGPGDIAAFERMERIRNWILHGPPCALCGEPAGSHANFGDFCPTPSGAKENFWLTRFREKRCGASVAIGIDDRSAVECGKPLKIGTDFCEEHGE
jgi:hypothetical protein